MQGVKSILLPAWKPFLEEVLMNIILDCKTVTGPNTSFSANTLVILLVWVSINLNNS